MKRRLCERSMTGTTSWALRFTVEGVDRSALFDAARYLCREYFGDDEYDMEIDGRPRRAPDGTVEDFTADVTARGK